MALNLAVVGTEYRTNKATEQFLLAQPDVLDASVWMNDGLLMAHVTLSEGSQWTEKALRVACARALGMENTPSEVVLLGARLKVA